MKEEEGLQSSFWRRVSQNDPVSSRKESKGEKRSNDSNDS